jgi:hypothetical protein
MATEDLERGDRAGEPEARSAATTSRISMRIDERKGFLARITKDFDSLPGGAVSDSRPAAGDERSEIRPKGDQAEERSLDKTQAQLAPCTPQEERRRSDKTPD